MSERKRNKVESVEDIMHQLPSELHEVARAIAKHLNVPMFCMGTVTMTQENGESITGIEIAPIKPTIGNTGKIPESNNGVVVLSIQDDWYIAILNESGDSTGGWSRSKSNTSIERVVEAIGSVLSGNIRS